MKLCRLIAKCVSRMKNQAEDVTQLSNYKFQLLKRYSSKYNSEDKFQHKQILFEQYLFQKNHYVAGTTMHNFTSQKFAIDALDTLQPSLVLLGGINDTFLRLGEHHFQSKKSYAYPVLKADKMLCKQRLMNYLQLRIQNDINFIWQQQSKQVYQIIPRDKRIIPSVYCTIAQHTSLDPYMNVVLSKPSDVVLFQDLILRYSIEQLKNICNSAIDNVMKDFNEDTDWQFSYTRQAIQNYVLRDEPDFFTRQVLYQTAMFKKYSKLTKKVLMFTPGHFVQRIATQVHHVDVNPDTIYRNGVNDRHSEMFGLVEKAKREGRKNVLLKFALITMIKQSWIQNDLIRGYNVFQDMSFKSLFQNMSIQQIHHQYKQAKNEVQGRWLQLVHHRINNIQDKRKGIIKYTLNQQFQVLQKRAKQQFPYEYEQKNYRSLIQNAAIMQALIQKMRELLNEEGDPQRKQVFDKFIKGQRTKQGIILYTKLLGKVNIQSHNRLKFPVFHYGAFRGLYKQYLRDFILKAESKSRISEKIKKRQQKIQKIIQKNMKKLENPIQIQKYLSGQKGKVLHLNMDYQDGPEVFSQDMTKLKELFGEFTKEDEQQMNELYGQLNNEQNDKYK